MTRTYTQHRITWGPYGMIHVQETVKVDKIGYRPPMLENITTATMPWNRPRRWT